MLTKPTRKLNEQAAIQRQREEEAAAKLAARKEAARVPERAPERVLERASEGADSTERTAPKLQLAGRTGGGWREREAAREAAGGAPPAPSRTEDVAPLRKTGGYVPPGKRADSGRESSPANGAGERFPRRQLREPSTSDSRSRTRTPTSGANPPPTEELKSTGNKWVPSWKKKEQA